MRRTGQEVMQATYTWFRDHSGEWPHFDGIDRRLNRYRAKPLDTARIIRRIPQRYLKPLNYIDGRPDPAGKVVLRLEGVARCQGSDDDVNRFMAALRLMAQKDRSYDPPPDKIGCGIPISAQWLAIELELPLMSEPHSIRRLVALLETEDLVSSDEYA